MNYVIFLHYDSWKKKKNLKSTNVYFVFLFITIPQLQSVAIFYSALLKEKTKFLDRLKEKTYDIGQKWV